MYFFGLITIPNEQVEVTGVGRFMNFDKEINDKHAYVLYRTQHLIYQ